MTNSIASGPVLIQEDTEHDNRLETPHDPLNALPVSAKRTLATQRLAAVGEMTEGIAHDFRGLLAAIASGLTLIERHADNPEKIHSYIFATREGIERGVGLISQLLAFAKHQTLAVHAGDLNNFLRGFEPLLRYGAGANIHVRLELGSDVPACMIDPTLFDAAILNLVINARDAMLRGGEVRIITDRWEREEALSGPLTLKTYVRVRVKDSGCGMSDDVLRNAFVPFFTTKGEIGTGIGLPQVQAFVRMFGGHVNIESETGIGTTVSLFLPAAAASS